MESSKAKSGEQRKVFFSLVPRSDHTLTNQQFVNCAYLEILSLCPALLCLPTCRQALASRVFYAQSLARPSFGLPATGWCSGPFDLSILLLMGIGGKTNMLKEVGILQIKRSGKADCDILCYVFNRLLGKQKRWCSLACLLSSKQG